MITVGIYGIQDTTHDRRPTYTHDHSVAIMRNGQVLSVVQLERWTGQKHDNRLPRYLNNILHHLLPPDEPVRFVSVNSFVGNSFITADGNLRIEPRRQVGISSDLVPADVTWFPDGLRRRPAEGWVLCHEAAHLTSLLPFIGHFESGALAAHIDGGASNSACSFWFIKEGKPILKEASWDLLKEVVNNFNVNPAVRTILGLNPEDHLAIPGRLMGYASYGTPRHELKHWLQEEKWMLGLEDNDAKIRILGKLGTTDPYATACQDLCATIQQSFTEEVVSAVLSHATNHKTLYLTGGAALNIPTNTALQSHFERVWVPPPTNDSGLALGAAAWVEYCDHGRLPLHHPFLNKFDVPYAEPEPEPGSVPEIARRLLDGDIIGVCNGAGEIGPRALGHRSILARADSVNIRVRVSEQIKHREWYRPVAPILCESAAREVLGDAVINSPLSKWMLGAWNVREAYSEALRGVIHTDGSVRAQVVPDDGQNAWMHSLLDHLWKQHGIPALINTSFNGSGEPILHRHDDALKVARNLGLDGVVIHGSLHRP